MNAWSYKLTAYNVAIWMLIVPLVCASIAYAPFAHHILGDPRDGDANEIVDPLAMILSYLTPIAFAGIIGLCVLWRRGLAKGWTVFVASMLFVTCTFSLVAFGIYGFYGTRLIFPM
jgi:hypothetical protein